jgi:hypothetical protein
VEFCSGSFQVKHVSLTMKKQHFNQLLKGVEEMKRHIAGKTVRDAVAVELPVPDVRVIREAALSARASLPN